MVIPGNQCHTAHTCLYQITPGHTRSYQFHTCRSYLVIPVLNTGNTCLIPGDTCQIQFIPVSHLIVPGHTRVIPVPHLVIPVQYCSCAPRTRSQLLITVDIAHTCSYLVYTCTILLIPCHASLITGHSCPILFIPAPYQAIPGDTCCISASYVFIPGHTFPYVVTPGHTCLILLIPSHTRSHLLIPGHTQSYQFHTLSCRSSCLTNTAHTCLVPGHNGSHLLIHGCTCSILHVRFSYLVIHVHTCPIRVRGTGHTSGHICCIPGHTFPYLVIPGHTSLYLLHTWSYVFIPGRIFDTWSYLFNTALILDQYCLIPGHTGSYLLIITVLIAFLSREGNASPANCSGVMSSANMNSTQGLFKNSSLDRKRRSSNEIQKQSRTTLPWNQQALPRLMMLPPQLHTLPKRAQMTRKAQRSWSVSGAMKDLMTQDLYNTPQTKPYTQVLLCMFF